ncbi:TPA: ead/Ea22-like family protein [Klebsiella pneumoniae]|uniref:ead/Ea22-like family protein n=2 Tax=Klebsiella pneumoniae TaxID=573 RepID=UPI00244E2598|nr:ead/Ea22-like family protein [Klebsiella pneumoniae]HCL9260180.1 ead/Ea22-like family protein [Escherichia coli]WGI82890.1 ead/Ea22-like family protein [Klebsiella pneumoniae]WGI88063.1 ead/Ea22-like family protein [Klebsiella pneumoniae]HBQ3249505.1 ead/Ea22-like family protein [Klebsiella pneumoniae]HBY6898500.1 ead/Ea22-like family protein [Klebsiella pneumoniae]
MTDITELAQSLKAAAEKATQGNWRAFKYHDGRCGIGGGHHDEIMVCEHISKRRPHDAEFIAMANPANILALLEALEKAQGMEAYWKTQCRGITDHCEELQARIAELEREQEHLRPVGVMSEKAFHRLENSECRFIALWPRPGIFLPRKRPEDGVIVYARTAAAAGIKVEAE